MRFFLFLTLFACLSCPRKERSIDYKSVPKPGTDTTYGYFIDVHKADSGYAHAISTSMHYGVAVVDGELTDYDARILFYGYDSSIIQIGKLYVVPLKAGKTIVFLRNPDHLASVADSIEVEVTKVHNKYSLQTHRAP